MFVQLLSYTDTFFWFFANCGHPPFPVALSSDVCGIWRGGEGFGDDHHADTDFKMLSIHSMTGFFMIFGWTGLAALHQFPSTR